MISFEVVYDQFLSTTNTNFGGLTDEEIQEDLYNWVRLASSYFKFPRVSLEHTVFTVENPGPNGEKGAYFLDNVTQKEITVIVEHMRGISINLQLTDAKKYDMYYQDANLKLPSQTAMITQLNRSLENQISKAKKVESDYYKAIDNKPTIGAIWSS